MTRKLAVCMMAATALSLRARGADAPDTASNVQPNGHGLRFSMVVPAISEDIRVNLPRLMVSVALQTIMPLEVVLVMSGVESTQCEGMKTSLVAGAIPLRVLCFQTLQNQAISRNVGVQAARGEWIAFVDADDAIFPPYFQVVSQHIHCMPSLLFILHGFTGETSVTFHDVQGHKIMYGDQLYRVADESRQGGKRGWLLHDVIHSHPVVKRAIAEKVLFRESDDFYRSEDSFFVRDVIDHIGPHRHAMLFDRAPLSWYMFSSDKKKHPGLFEQRSAAVLDGNLTLTVERPACASEQRRACLSDEEALCLSRLPRHELWDLGQLVGGEFEQLVTEPSGWGHSGALGSRQCLPSDSASLLQEALAELGCCSETLQTAEGAAEDAVHLTDPHGNYHPAVSIRFDSKPLVLLPTVGTMELTFQLLGTVPGFTYKVAVQEIDTGDRTVMQHEEVTSGLGHDASSHAVSVTLWTLDPGQETFRFLIAVWDAHEGLAADEALVAQRDLTISPVSVHGEHAPAVDFAIRVDEQVMARHRQSGPGSEGANHANNPALLPMAIVVPSRPEGMCKHGSLLAQFSVNTQTVKPTRVIVGISSLTRLSFRASQCLKEFRALLDVPLTLAIGKAQEAPGASRNFALEKLQEGECALLHDDDEYLHPQAVEFAQWSFARYPQDEVLVMAYLYQWGTKTPAAQTPWCLGRNFSALFTTTELEPSRPGSNVQVKPGVDRPRCRNLVHGYPAFRSSPLRRFGIRYKEHRNRGEDGQFLQALLDAGATMRFTCFPVVAYRSLHPTTTLFATNSCPCWMGFAHCDTELGNPDPFWLSWQRERAS